MLFDHITHVHRVVAAIAFADHRRIAGHYHVDIEENLVG
jgi:hypothetical protein